MTDESNNRPTAALAAIEAYLCNYEPDTGGTSLKTTDAIIRDLEDMVDIDTETVAQAMLDHGYTIVWQPNGRHGWAMRLLV
ncbi:MAG: hypothetical protein IJ724_07250 [Muribaculaceae bacterium]|nr:hypothetical protein [Muribaculaceae bacterium]MBR1726427.1 hypothetical protein [Muribaculaceae bacterium]